MNLFVTSEPPETEFIEKVQQRLQQCNIPITIGCNGNINLIGTVNSLPCKCWCKDSHGRIVIKWNNNLMIQRGNSIMYGIINKENPSKTVVSNQLPLSMIHMYSSMI